VLGSSPSRLVSRRLLIGVLAGVAVLALAVAAPGMASSKKKFAGPPVKVMTIASVNYNGPNFKNIHEAAKTYAKWINDKGGIGGRELVVNACDDKGDPNTLIACGRTAIKEKAVAVVGSFTLNADKIVPILSQAKIPWFGICCPTTGPEFGDPISFPMGSGIGVIAGQAYLAADICKGKINLLELDIPGAPFIELLVKNTLASKGQSAKLGKIVKVPAVVGGDIAPYVAEVTSDAVCVVSGLGEANWAQFLPAIKASGTKVQFFGAQGNLDEKVVGPFGNMSDNYIACGVYPNIDKPAWKDYRAALVKYKADPKQDYNSLGGLGTWAAFTGFNQIAAPIKNLTNLTFLAAANKANRVDTKGMTPIIDFTKPWTDGLEGFSRLFNRKVTFLTFKNGKQTTFKPGFFDLSNAFTGKTGK
jgi:ABC-type branched-subunit amino acid transport system substrate-binding protein